MNWFKKIILSSLSKMRVKEFLKMIAAYGIYTEKKDTSSWMLLNPHNKDKKATIHFHSKGEDLPLNTIKTTTDGLGIYWDKFKERYLSGERYKPIPEEKLGEYMELPIEENIEEDVPDWMKSDWYLKQQQYADIGT